MNKPEIKKSELVSLQQQGFTRKEIADKYEVPVEEMNKYFKVLGITGKAGKKLKYAPVDDTAVANPQTSDVTAEAQV